MLITVVMQRDHREIMLIPKIMPLMVIVQMLVDDDDGKYHDVVDDGVCDFSASMAMMVMFVTITQAC